jgi:glycosyltransferase involved in cell wall biosynthesis
MPKITVIMPVYNCEGYVQEAINSILEQTFTDFEFLVIDDASTDDTVSVIKTYSDPRIRLIVKPVNSGYTDSLNMALDMARGEFIARMDGDDISLPGRFEKQLKEFERNPRLALCGSNMEIIGTGEIINYPQTHDEIKVELLKICCVAHPSVMMRSAFLKSNNLFYDRTKEPAEDYNLWVRMIKTGRFANIAEPLLKYRVHANQVSTTKQAIRVESALNTKSFHLSSIVNRAAAKKFYSESVVIAAKNVLKEVAFINWLEHETAYLKEKNRETYYFAEQPFDFFLKDHQRKNARTIFLQSKIYNPKTLLYFIKYALKHPGAFSFSELVKTSTKCLLFYKIK